MKKMSTSPFLHNYSEIYKLCNETTIDTFNIDKCLVEI